MEKQTGKVIKVGTAVVTKLMKPFGYTKEMIDLTGTCALEHFTSTIAAELYKTLKFKPCSKMTLCITYGCGMR